MSVKKPKKAFTSIRVDPELWKEVKIEAIRRDVEVSDLVAEALRKELSLPNSLPKKVRE